jgi:hypothetical protein
VTAATVRVPRPVAVDGVVVNDVATRTLAVRLSETAGGYAQQLWREAHQALLRAQESEWRTGHPALWGALWNRQIVHGLPADYQTLTFTFYPGEPAYAKLVGTPGLAAIVTLERELCRFLSVQFLNRGLA